MAKLLGELLCDAGLISAAQLEAALAQQAAIRVPLGQILVHEGWLAPLALQQILAQQNAQTLVDISSHPIDPALLQPAHMSDYFLHQTLPWQWSAEGALQLACVQPDEGAIAWAKQQFPHATQIDILRITRRDFKDMLQQHMGEELTAHALEHLFTTQPHYSARRVLTYSQKVTLFLLFASIVALGIAQPTALWFGFWFFCLGFFTLYLGFKLFLWWRGHAVFPSLENQLHALPDLMDDALPSYTVLVPLYKEAESIPRLIAALNALDYPKAKLDIKLVIEADDAMTWNAIVAAHPSGMFEVIRVPPSQPRTKPKACNYALWFARGELVTIYDAEDAPHPRQLRDAAKMLQAGAPNGLGCVQARLNYYNHPTNWLTRCFALEYALWFDSLLPALQTLGMPLPLGGTSNHLPRATLEQLGAWDPYNVTEDADLGLRLATHGKHTALLPSLTLEEAPSTLMVWVRQRTRWIKGYMITYAVHMRAPRQLWQQIGARGFWGVQLFIGLPCLAFLLGPLAIALGLLTHASALGLPMPVLLSSCLWGLFALHVAVHLLVSTRLLKRLAWQGMLLATLTFPIYWFLHSFSCLRAVGQLLFSPHLWEKTPHGQNITAQGVDFASPAR